MKTNQTILQSVKSVALITAAFLVTALPVTRAQDQTITTVAGSTDDWAFFGDGGPATEAGFSEIVGVAVLPDGGFLIADAANNRIRKVDANGIVTTVAGNGLGFRHAYSGEGGPATQAVVWYPTGVAPMADGGFLVAGYGHQRLFKVDPQGTLTTVVQPSYAWSIKPLTGGGFVVPSYPGIYTLDANGGNFTTVVANHGADDVPYGVAATTDGGYLYTDTYRHRVLKAKTDGTITVVAGTGVEGFSGDGGPATAARLAYPWDVLALPDGGFLLSDYVNHRIRKVDANGIITTVAGNGIARDAGDGGSPLAASIPWPTALAATADGGYLIGEWNGRVRKVSPAFIIVAIDIKPGTYPNSINLGSKGTVPVAILSSDAFDATTIDPSTVTLAGAPIKVANNGRFLASAQDVDGDGRLDLIVHVDTTALALTGDEDLAILEGQTWAGQLIRGTDSVRLVP
ncbi:MAG: hypothetical protein HY735_24185 [Verrucomicrobia bacterium]|nr:hypothetical protein [Verrucomicrobiota bacterium]